MGLDIIVPVELHFALSVQRGCYVCLSISLYPYRLF